METAQPKPANAALADMLKAIETAHRPIDFRLETYGNYSTARFMAQLISALGWLTIVAAGIYAFGVIDSLRSMGVRNAPFMYFAPAFGVAGAGVLLIASGQITRAVIDTAAYTAQIARMAHLALTQSSQEPKRR